MAQENLVPSDLVNAESLLKCQEELAMDLENCPNCGVIFIKNPVREICAQCFQAEEDEYDLVYNFLKKRENRAATIDRVAEATGVQIAKLHNWVRRGRLQTVMFPNLGYPCDQCGKIIRDGKLCKPCAAGLMQDLQTFDEEQARMKEMKQAEKGTYLGIDRKSRE